MITGYQGDETRNAEAMARGFFHTGDLATRDEDGHIIYVGRTDDVFKASDYKVSPFELESVLKEHPAVAEAAVVPAPDLVRLAVPKAYVALVSGHEPAAETAESILRYARKHLAPYLRVRRLEFFELPKTISGKIRRVELRRRELEAGDRGQRASTATETSPISRSCARDARQSCRQGCLSPHTRYLLIGPSAPALIFSGGCRGWEHLPSSESPKSCSCGLRRSR